MGSFSNYTENKVLEHIVGEASFTMPTAFVALYTADPTDTGTGSQAQEVTLGANSYSRVATNTNHWASASGGTIKNGSDITFPEASGAWGTVTHFAILDASGTAANMLAHSALTATKAISSGDTPKFAADALTITLD